MLERKSANSRMMDDDHFPFSHRSFPLPSFSSLLREQKNRKHNVVGKKKREFEIRAPAEVILDDVTWCQKVVTNFASQNNSTTKNIMK